MRKLVEYYELSHAWSGPQLQELSAQKPKRVFNVQSAADARSALPLLDLLIGDAEVGPCRKRSVGRSGLHKRKSQPDELTGDSAEMM